MIVWCSDEYKKMYRHKYNNLARRTDTIWSSDMLYDTMIGLFGVNTGKYNSKYDFTSDSYNLKQEDALVFNGAKNYTDKSNYIYWQDINSKYLVDTNQSLRIFPNNVNSAGELKDIWNEGFRSFGIDLWLDNESALKLGSSEEALGLELKELLSYIDYAKIKHIYLHIQNMNNTNYKKVLQQLEILNKKFNLKDKSTISSKNKLEFFRQFKQKGWVTSFSLPTKRILNLMKENNISAREKFAEKISQKIILEEVSAVLFDPKVYPFIKKYIEPKLSNNTIYHGLSSPSLDNKNFKQQLLENKLFLDDRVKILFTAYRSQFDL